jgi:hypothetical protein
MTRRRSSRSLLELRVPRKGTVIIAAVLYIIGLFGALGWWPVPQPLAIAALAIAGGLLFLGVLLRGL